MSCLVKRQGRLFRRLPTGGLEWVANLAGGKKLTHVNSAYERLVWEHGYR